MFDITTTTALRRTAQPFARSESSKRDLDVGASDVRQNRLAAERALDEVLAESFPASDPPSWTPGMVRPAPAAPAPFDEVREQVVAHARQSAPATAIALDAPRPATSERTFIDALISLAAACGLALLVPFAILLVGAPIAFLVRGVAASVTSLLAFIVR